MNSYRDQDFWKRKLLAFLHDPPAKPFDLWRHEEDADRFKRQAGLLDEEFSKTFDRECDHLAAAADRFPFPDSRKAGLGSSFTGSKDTPFLHPLGGSSLVFNEPFPSSGVANTPFDTTQPGLHMFDRSAVGPELSDWANFFLHWRLWPDAAADVDGRASFIPADTRIPDHTIWNHMALTSALYAAKRQADTPAFLLFQLGPVQEFIAQARSCRDLLSGSLLLSWLAAHAIKAVTDRVGPDCVLTPSLRGIALFDALHREELYEKLKLDDTTGDSLWNRLRQEFFSAEALLTPNLPNRLVAIVPSSSGRELALSAAENAKAELRRIANHVWHWVEQTASEAGCTDAPAWKARYDKQIDAFLQITWQVSPVETDLCNALADFASLPAGVNSEAGRAAPATALDQLHRLATELIPREHRDGRCFVDETAEPGVLSNPGFAWSAWHAAADAALAGRRNTRDFVGWAGSSATKDSLSGREEMIGTPEFWEYLERAGEAEKVFHGKGKPLGAMNLIKRLWCHPDLADCCLREALGLRRHEYLSALRFDDTREVSRANADSANPYLAVLALDGDEMGKWLSGAKTPAFRDCLSAGAREYFDRLAEDREAVGPILASPRPLFPSYHLQFSEALTNFSRLVARPVVKGYAGQLVYSGGDDVLALVPADRAVACAQALRAAFRGECLPGKDDDASLEVGAGIDLARVEGCPGFLYSRGGDGQRIFTVPGPAADVSCGIAVGHYKAPLQELVREARRAEARAKNEYGRGALAVSLYKRSGEIIRWGCKWDNGKDRVALRLMHKVSCLSAGEDPPLSGRFPYVLAGLLAPYRLAGKPDVPPEVLCEIILTEFRHVMDRQGAGLTAAQAKELDGLAGQWIDQTANRLEDFVALFLVETFMNRNRGED